MPETTNHNNQYQKNEQKILRGYLAVIERVGSDGIISLTSISEASGVPYRTVVGHYTNFAELERSNVEKSVSMLCRLADESRDLGDDCRTFLKKLLLTVSRESIRFQIEYSRRSISAWEQILSYSRDILTKNWSSYGDETNDIIFHRFCAEFIGTIFLWGRSEFSVTELENHLTSLIYLVEHAAKREIIL